MTPKNFQINEKWILKLLKNYATDNKTFYLHFYDESIYREFNSVYGKYVCSSGMKLVRCTKSFNFKIMLIKIQQDGKLNYRAKSDAFEKLLLVINEK